MRIYANNFGMTIRYDNNFENYFYPNFYPMRNCSDCGKKLSFYEFTRSLWPKSGIRVRCPSLLRDFSGTRDEMSR